MKQPFLSCTALIRNCGMGKGYVGVLKVFIVGDISKYVRILKRVLLALVTKTFKFLQLQVLQNIAHSNLFLVMLCCLVIYWIKSFWDLYALVT